MTDSVVRYGLRLVAALSHFNLAAIGAGAAARVMINESRSPARVDGGFDARLQRNEVALTLFGGALIATTFAGPQGALHAAIWTSSE
jgi:hypothetical protein